MSQGLWFFVLCRRLALLVGGDTLALLLFAAIGRRNHGEGLQLLQTLNTAVPFLVGLSLLLRLPFDTLTFWRDLRVLRPEYSGGKKADSACLECNSHAACSTMPVSAAGLYAMRLGH